MHEILSEKYGEQEIEEEWHDNTWRNDHSEKGYAIERGHVDMSCTWETNTTEIYHEITGVDYKIKHIVRYKSKELQDLLHDRVDRSGLNVL